MNSKQLKWSTHKVQRTISKKITRFILLIIVMFLAVGYVAARDNYTLNDFGTSVLMAAGSSGTLAYAVVLGNPTNPFKAGKIIKASIFVLAGEDYDDTQAFPTKVNGARGNIPLKAGTYWKKLEIILDSAEGKWAGSVGDVAAIIKNSISFILGGMDKTVFDWLESRISMGHYVVFELCLETETKRYLIGNGCKPAKLFSFEGGSTKDYTGTTATFEQECGELMSEYIGNTPLIEPAAILESATAITLVTGNDTYLIAAGTASTEIVDITGVASSDENRIITVKGGGGAGPSKIVDGTGFVLVGGEDWVGTANAQISFKIFRDGASTYKFIEIAGSRT